VRPQLEDASGPYEFPTGAADWTEVYFTLPDRFWLEQDFARLSLPGIAMLLVIAKETNKRAEVRMTHEQIAEWYGFSRATVAKGLKELDKLGVLETRVEWIPAKLSKIRTTQAHHFSLKGDYATDARKTARANAERRRKRAAAGSKKLPTFKVDEEGGENDDE
jgi:hypothetical protein